MTWLCPLPDLCPVWFEFDPRENGFANACEEAGDVACRDEVTDRFKLELRLIVLDRVVVLPLRVTLVVRVKLALRLIDPFLL